MQAARIWIGTLFLATLFSPTDSGAATHEVTVSGLSFVPNDLVVAPGDTVRWTWSAALPHDVTADDGSYSSGAPSTQDTFERTFNEIGDSFYHCTVHSSAGQDIDTFMNGVVRVQDSNGAPDGDNTLVMSIAGGESFVNHYPGPDGLIGTADDVVSGALSNRRQSEPNHYGTLGYNAFAFSSSGPQDPNLPTGFDALTFVEGRVRVDLDVLSNGGGPILTEVKDSAAMNTALDISSGTEPFPGHGAYASKITRVNGGTYDPATGDFTLDVDIRYTIAGSDSDEPGVMVTGTAIFRDSAQFGTATGNAYVDNVAVPFAQAAGASRMLFMSGTGTLTSLGYPVTSTLVALDGKGFRINSGLNDAWVFLDTAGQGVFLVVYPELGRVFLAMFTYDVNRPPPNVTAVLGESGHRWFTGFGPITGNEAELEAILTRGGIFDALHPDQEDVRNYGTVKLRFNHCNELILTYDFPALMLSGTITMSRVANDNIDLCNKLNKVPPP
jgi:plastocyanin